MTGNDKIVLFDGTCNFCDKGVQFIIKRDPKGLIQFASLQSNIGKSLLNKYHAPRNLDSLVLIENSHIYFKSTAVLRICKNLQGVWKIFYSLLIIPKPLRDFFYDCIAKNRHELFGTKDHCILPTADIRKRFL